MTKRGQDERPTGWRRVPRAAWAGVAGLGVILGILAALNSLEWWPFEGEVPADVRIDFGASRFNPASDEAAGEYVCLVNAGGDAVELDGWELRDSRENSVRLGEFVLQPGAAVRVHTGGGKASRGGDLYGEGGQPVWDNDGDAVTLLDPDGAEADAGSYGERAEPDGGSPCG